MTPVNRHMIEFWDSKNAFWDLYEPEEYCCKISASYDSTTPNRENQWGNSPLEDSCVAVLDV